MSYRNLDEFYKSKEWEKFREMILLERVSEDGVLYCEYSGEPIVKRYDAIVHHKIELTETNVFDANIALNPDNVMVVSFKSHNKIHRRFNGFKQEVYLVYGSPCSGKSTWVSNVASNDDLILDIDRLWEAICFSDKYNKPNRLKANAFGLRDCLIEQIKTRTGMWCNAYIIGTYPLRSDRDRLCSLLKAKPIFINETKDKCLNRAKNEEWKEYIEEWFDIFTP